MELLLKDDYNTRIILYFIEFSMFVSKTSFIASRYKYIYIYTALELGYEYISGKMV